jgi:hypothetical protein
MADDLHFPPYSINYKILPILRQNHMDVYLYSHYLHFIQIFYGVSFGLKKAHSKIRQRKMKLNKEQIRDIYQGIFN